MVNVQSLGKARPQFGQSLCEDDRVAVLVGVDESDPILVLQQGGLEDRHHRGDATAGGQQDEMVVPALGSEHARRLQCLEPHPTNSVVVQPM